MLVVGAICCRIEAATLLSSPARPLLDCLVSRLAERICNRCRFEVVILVHIEVATVFVTTLCFSGISIIAWFSIFAAAGRCGARVRH
ncbi:hypothetical protein WT12_08215 [Burkholderia territorii]|nr:hypothetical protein WT12_08215 [Burkholderia territorii]